MPSDLNLCMIVRDEAERLPEFLRAAAGCWDRLVAVDTGSADATPDLLAAAGAEVHHQAWADDFARARNESLRHARGRWVLVLDADEYPEPGFAEELRALIADPTVGAATIHRADAQRNGIIRYARPLRLFRADPAIRYVCRIHEDASASIHAVLARDGLRLAALETPVRHIGYVEAEMRGRDKQARDERLLKMALADDPADLYSRYKLLELYRFWKTPHKARPVARGCLKLLRAGAEIRPPHIAGDLAMLVHQALFADAADGGLGFLREIEPRTGCTGHFRLALGRVLEARKAFAGAAAEFRRARELAAGDPARDLIETRALAGLTRLALATGDLAAARAHALAASRLAPEDPEVRLALRFLAGQAD